MAAVDDRLRSAAPGSGRAKHPAGSRRRRRLRLTTDQRLIILSSLVALGIAGGVVEDLVTDAGLRPGRPLTRQVSAGPDHVLSIGWLGDTMLGDGAKADLETKGYQWAFDLLPPATDVDFTIVNAEAPVTLRTKPWDPTSPYSYNVPPVAAHAMAQAGVDAISLANNHSMDRGPAGLRDTMANARAAGMTAFGGGRNTQQAARPLLIKSSVATVAVVAFGEDFGEDSNVTRETPGAMVLSAKSIQRAVSSARKAGADAVVAYVHWGDNYTAINAQQRFWARQFAAAGYSLVVGTGPHVAQPIRYLRGMPVVYSIGNFVFGTPGRFGRFHQPGVGLTLTAQWTDAVAFRLLVGCLAVDNDTVDYQPRACAPEQAAQVLPGLSPGQALVGTVGVLAPASGG